MTNEQEAKRLIFEAVKGAVNELQAHYEKFTTENKINSVPIEYIKAGNKIFLNAYEKGVNEPITVIDKFDIESVSITPGGIGISGKIPQK